MQDHTRAYDIATETFADHTDMGEAEAAVHVRRELMGQPVRDIARELDKAEQTVSNQLTSAREKAALPPIERVDRHRQRVPGRGRGYTIAFANGAALRYEYDEERDTILEETMYAGDPDSVYESHSVGGEASAVPAYTLESIREYINTYREDVEACRRDWGPVFAALTGFE